jgi:hypothetical protein
VDLRKNLSVKLMGLVLAFISWVWVESQGDLLKTMDVTVDLSGLPGTLEVVGPLPRADVQLRGPEPSLRTLAPERVMVRVDVGSQPLQPGINLIPLDPKQVRVPAGIQVDRIDPSVLELNVERTVTKEVPVEPAIQGLPAPGYEVAGTVVQPSRVAIEGPESAMKEVESVSTRTISIDGVSENQSLEMVPLPVGPAGRKVRLVDPSVRVDVRVRIRPLTAERTLSRVPVVARGVPVDGPRPSFTPAWVEVHVTGPEIIVHSLSPDQLQAVADLTGQPPSATDLRSSSLVVRPAEGTARGLEELEYSVIGAGSIRVTWEEETGR